MPQKLVVGPFKRGLRNDVTAFNIDNDSFPTLINAYQWRGRVKRKRGTSLLGRLTRFFNSTISSYNSGSTTITLNGSGVGNLITGFSLQANSNIVPGSVTITRGGNTYTDPAMNGNLSPSGTINYASGSITILAEAGQAVSASFRYNPSLPVMGLEDLNLNPTQNPGTLAFDTTYSYNIKTTSPFDIYNVSFYKNLATATYTGYTQKTNWTPTTWNGQDYQQFWSTNYQGAFWVTNGMNVPFSITNIGMQYKSITTVTVVSPTSATLAIANHGLVIGDFVFINEVATTTGINFQTGYVTAIVANVSVTVTFPNSTIATNGTGGIAQYLTNRSDTTKDCIRWYDGDPTDGNITSPTFVAGKGWVNFCPPLSKSDFSISDLPADQYYLVGAKMILPFKDRLIFFGPVVQTSAVGSQVYLQDTVIYSQNGTPFYTASFTGDPSSATTVFNPILVPANQTSSSASYFSDQTGFGGFQTVGVSQPMISASANGDVLVVGFSTIQTKMVYTGNDIVPFNFYTINSELGSASTFSIINMDKGILTVGSRGFIISNQVGVERIDLEIPDEVFEIKLTDNGAERITAQRDFINEWCYFTYPVNSTEYVFPGQTLQYNYRDNSWGVFYESYTHYGSFRKQDGFTWSNVGDIFPTWSSWNEPWNAGSSTLLQPLVIAGNQQGFVVFRDDGTQESNSLYIQDISGSTITSSNHCLNEGDFIVISGALGTVGSLVNDQIFSVSAPVTEDEFNLSPALEGTGTYSGDGVIKRMYRPYIQTKQFPAAWDMARKTRIGPQQYLLTTTEEAQIQLLVFLSQNSDDPYNTGPIVPSIGSLNNSLIYSTILYTCPESTNLGLTPANTNLQMPTAIQQAQIWHRMNTSLIGDSVQIGFTISDEQMRDETLSNQFAEIEIHGFIIELNPSQVLV